MFYELLVLPECHNNPQYFFYNISKTLENCLPVMILEAELQMPSPLSFAAGCGGGGMLGLGRGRGAGLEGRGRDPEW